MEKSSNFDSLAEFHLHSPPMTVHALLAHVIQVLESNVSPDIDALWEQLSNQVSEEDAERILQLACKKTNVDFFKLVKHSKTHINHITLRLLLRMIAFPLSYVAAKLQIDQFRAAQLLDQLRSTLIIDDPLTWLRDLEFYAEQERLTYELEKTAQLHGAAAVHKEADTAEERKRRLRALRPHIDPL